MNKTLTSKFLAVLSLGLLSALLGTPSLLAAVNPQDTTDEAMITGIQLDGKDVIVTAHVPTGLKKLTFQSSQRLGTGAWTPRAVLRLDGAGGEVTFRVSRASDLEIVRVRADDGDPLPSLFYRGTNVFEGALISTSTNNPDANGYFLNGNALPPGAAAGESVDASKGAQGPARDVVESDIWQIRGDTLYFFNQYRGLQVIALANPDAPVVSGTLSLPAAGEQMYLLADNHVVLLARDGCGWGAGSSSQVLVVGTTDGVPSISASLPLSGEIQESRLVGTALYVMTQTYQPVLDSKDGAWQWGTSVYAFDLANPAAPVARTTLFYAGNGNVLSATDQFLFISVSDNWTESMVHCIDISAPDGVMQKASSIAAAGRVIDKFKMQVNGDVFTVISEQWSWQLPNGTGRWQPVTKLETVSLADPTTPQKLGELELAVGEQLHATRFDGDRVYVVTFFQKDPLWVVDLSDPKRPAIRGVGSSRVDLQACKLEYSIVSPK